MHSVIHIHNNVHLRFDMRSNDQTEAPQKTQIDLISRNRRFNEDETINQQVEEASKHYNDRNGKPRGNNHEN